MTKPLPLKVGDRARHDNGATVEVVGVDDDCATPHVKVRYPNGGLWWELRSLLRKLPDRKEGA